MRSTKRMTFRAQRGISLWLATASSLTLAAIGWAASGSLRIKVESVEPSGFATVQLVNSGAQAITFSLSLCGSILADWAPPEIGARSSPTFDVQILNKGKWGSLLWGCDYGPLATPSPFDMGPGKTIDFRLKFIQPGTYRLKLDYEYLAPSGQTFKKKHRQAQSDVFVIPFPG
jgi:hypothetical protein